MDYIQLAIFAGLFALGVGIGGATTYKLEQSKILNLKLAIEQANEQSQRALLDATNKTNQINIEQQQRIVSIQTEHAKSIESIDRLSDKLRIARVQSNANNARSSCAVPEASDTSISKNATAPIDNAARLDRDAKIADENAAYAKAAYDWAQSIPTELIAQ